MVRNVLDAKEKTTSPNQKFDYKITYKKGSDIIIADALSRAPVEDDNFQFNFSEVNLLEFLAVSEQTRDRLVSATKEDKDLQKLIKLIKQGFPMQYKILEPQLKHLYKFRDYLSTKDDLIFYKDSLCTCLNEKRHEEEGTHKPFSSWK